MGKPPGSEGSGWEITTTPEKGRNDQAAIERSGVTTHHQTSIHLRALTKLERIGRTGCETLPSPDIRSLPFVCRRRRFHSRSEYDLQSHLCRAHADCPDPLAVAFAATALGKDCDRACDARSVAVPRLEPGLVGFGICS